MKKNKFKEYLSRMKSTSQAPPRMDFVDICLSFVGAFIGMSVVWALHYYMLGKYNLPMFVASFAASAVLVFGAFRSPLAQPRNVIGGHFFSALVGVSIYKLIGHIDGNYYYFSICVVVPCAIFVMHLTKTLHPPGGATAMMAIIGGEAVHQLGYVYAFFPCALGALALILVGVFFNNTNPKNQYPQFWI